MVVHSNDMYFYGSDGYSKNRESVVLVSNKNKEVALVKLTTSNNPNYKDISNYPGSRYMTNNVFISDNSGKPIVVSDAKYIDEMHKFIQSHFSNVPIESVNDIEKTLCSNSKYGKRNSDYLNKLKKRK